MTEAGKIANGEQGGALRDFRGQEVRDVHSMHSLFPKWVGFTVLFLLVGNVGLQVFSHLGVSIVIRANVDPDSGGLASLNNVQNCVALDPGFGSFWQGGGNVSFADDLLECGDDFLGITIDGLSIVEEKIPEGQVAFLTCMTDDLGISIGAQCSSCYSSFVECGVISCAFACFALTQEPPTLSSGCQICAVDACAAQFENCTSFSLDDLPPRTRRLEAEAQMAELQASRRSLQEEEIELFDIYEVSFVRSARDAFKSGAYLVGIVLVLLSGVWPYVKNVIMLVAWFVPMSLQQRSSLLKNLTRLAKWSLVDVFVIVIVLVGLRLDEESALLGRVIVFAEARIAIYTFALAAIWDLAMGEWMRLKHLEIAEAAMPVLERKDPNAALLSSVTFATDDVSSTSMSCTSVGRLVFFGLCVAEIVALVASSSVTSVSYETAGFAPDGLFNGSTFAEYNVISIATELLGEESLDLNSSVPGTVFLIVVYLLCAVGIPLFQFIAIPYVLAATPKCCSSTGRFKTFATVVDIVGGFASFDVFFLSLFVVQLEWDNFVNAALLTLTEGLAESLCPSPCLTFNSTLEPIVGLMVVAVLIGWVLELLFTYAFAQTFHPIEQTTLGPKLFNKVLPAGKCAART